VPILEAVQLGLIQSISWGGFEYSSAGVEHTIYIFWIKHISETNQYWSKPSAALGNYMKNVVATIGPSEVDVLPLGVAVKT
jgi:hypothetical protein